MTLSPVKFIGLPSVGLNNSIGLRHSCLGRQLRHTQALWGLWMVVFGFLVMVVNMLFPLVLVLVLFLLFIVTRRALRRVFRSLAMVPMLAVSHWRYPLIIVIQRALGALIVVPIMALRALAATRERFAHNALDRLVRPEQTRAGPGSEDQEDEQECADDIGENIKANRIHRASANLFPFQLLAEVFRAKVAIGEGHLTAHSGHRHTYSPPPIDRALALSSQHSALSTSRRCTSSLLLQARPRNTVSLRHHQSTLRMDL